MSSFVIDASFAIKWLLPEKGSEKALSILDELQRFYVPDLFLIETDSIITKKIRRKEIDVSEAVILSNKIRKFPYVSIPYQNIQKLALELSSTMYISHYDACYLAVAIEYSGILYTADLRMYNGLQSTPFSDYAQNIEKL